METLQAPVHHKDQMAGQDQVLPQITAQAVVAEHLQQVQTPHLLLVVMAAVVLHLAFLDHL